MENIKLFELGKRIYNNKMTETKDENGAVLMSDEGAIKALCAKVFTSNGEVNSMEELRNFNRLIVEVAEDLAKGNFEQVINLVADYQTVGRYDIISYKVNKLSKVSMALSASATGVDFVKIPSRSTKTLARPEQYQFGVKYSIEEMVSDPVNAFRNAVNLIMEWKVKFIFNKIMAITKVAKTAGKIPAKQVSEVANLGLADYRKLEGSLLRYGRGVRPVMIADINFINALAEKQATAPIVVAGSTYYLTDAMRETLLKEINIEQVSKTICIATENPFVDDMNSKVDLPVSEALILAGGIKSPFMIREFGPMRTAQDMPSIEKEQVLLKVDLRLDVTLLLSSAIAYIVDTAVIL